MKYVRYKSYAPALTPFVTKRPIEWREKKLRFLCQLNPSRTEVASLDDDLQVSFIPMEKVSEEGVITLDTSLPLEKVKAGFTYFRDGDVLIAKITPCFENGKGALCRKLTNGIGFGTTEFHVLRPRSELSARFLFYITKAEQFRRIGEIEMSGAAGQKRVPESFLQNLRILIPSQDDQEAIADFLDDEIDRIGRLIAKKELLLKLLEEKRAGLVSHAVTRGLDTKVKLRDSGLPFLGKIPAHWKLTGLKRSCLFVGDGTHQPPKRVTAGGFPLLSVRNIIGDQFQMLPDDSLVSAEDFEVLRKSYEPKEGDVLLAIIGATLGKVAIVPKMPPFVLQRSLGWIRMHPAKMLNTFCWRLMQSNFFQETLWDGIGFSAQPGIYLGMLKDIRIPVPPLSEQQRIVEMLNDKVQKIESVVTKIEESVALLHEHRAALISAAVTGKIDVRNT